jgi:hypothetical protein
LESFGSLLSRPTPLPWSYRLTRIAPEPASVRASFGLGLPIARLDVGAGIPDILLVDPGKAVANLIEIGFDAIDINDGLQFGVFLLGMCISDLSEHPGEILE